MSFLSIPFFCFFPVVALGYYLMPRRGKNLWLLLASWVFYLCAKPIYLTLLLAVIVTSYVTGRILAKKSCKGVLVACLLLDVVLLFLFKYVNFVLTLVAAVLNGVGAAWTAPVLDLVLPVGISFYLFQAMGYVIDVYRGKVQAERNFILYALFLSFFPQVVSGPIGRAEELFPQFREEHFFDYDRLRRGLLRFLWGAVLKLVLADRLGVLVNTVYAAPETFGAIQVIGAAVAYSLQIYCDFAAYTHMALGTADAMGFALRENFRAPYFSRSIADFWRRWHMSLTSWFRDYLYIPLGGSRKGPARKFLNILIVFTVSGLWHGAAMTFVIWGLLNGVYQVAGALTVSVRDRLMGAIGLTRKTKLRKYLQILVTFLLTTVAWVFFRAENLTQVGAVFGGMISGPLWVAQSMGLSKWDLLLALAGLVVLFLVELRCVNHDLAEEWLTCARPVRWIILWVLLFACLVFGCYGSGYDVQSFLYGFNF